jgi:energy-coupling factor transport system permease protein
MTAADGPPPQLARLDPTLVLGCVFVVSAVLTLVFDPVTPAVLWLLAVVVARAAARLPWRRVARAQLPFLGVAAGLVTVNALSRPGEVLWQAGPLIVTAEGLSVGASLGARCLVIGTLSVAFVASTRPERVVASLRDRLGVPARAAYSLAAGYRLLGSLPGEWQTVRAAYAVRAPLGRDGRPRPGLRGLRSSAFTLLVVSVRRGERIARALEARGTGLEPRTVWRPVVLGRADALAVLAVLGALAAVVAGSWACGTLRGPGALG